MSNLSLVLAERPTGDIIPGKTFVQKKTPIPTADQLQNGQILVETLYVSLDPAMRGWLNDARSYLPPVQIGEVMRASSIVRVLASKSSQAAVGDIVTTIFAGWTHYAILKEGKFDPASKLPKTSCATDLISGVGLTGLTAYFGMTKIGEPKAGDLVVVSGAAGATGSVAGQIAKLKGARVVGIAGSDDKARYLTEKLGFDVGLNYKAADFKQKFSAATKDLIDVYFDNVGGEILDMALRKAKPFFAVCHVWCYFAVQSPIQGKARPNQPGQSHHDAHQDAGLHCQRLHQGISSCQAGAGELAGDWQDQATGAYYQGRAVKCRAGLGGPVQGHQYWQTPGRGEASHGQGKSLNQWGLG